MEARRIEVPVTGFRLPEALGVLEFSVRIDISRQVSCLQAFPGNSEVM